MAKVKNAAKAHNKAQAIKGAAIGTFTTAKNKVEEANQLLLESISLDEQAIESIEANIVALNGELGNTKAQRQSKIEEIEENKRLIDRLVAFV